MRRNCRATLGAVAIFLALLSAPALAANQRSFVASTGVDSNPCTIAAPCRSLATALAATSSGGQVVILDTAGYGSALTIAQSVSIIAPPGISALMKGTGGPIITVNGSNIRVYLQGLILDSGTVLFQAGRFLSLDRMQIDRGGVQHNASNGVLFMGDTLLRGGSTCFTAQTTTPSTPALATIVNSRLSIAIWASSARQFQSHHFQIHCSRFHHFAMLCSFIALGDATGSGHLNLDDIVATSCNYGVVAGPLVTGGPGFITLSNSLITSNTEIGVGAFGASSGKTFGNNKVYNNKTDYGSGFTPIAPTFR